MPHSILGIPSSNVYTPGVGFGFTCKAGGSFFGLTKCGNLGLGSMKPKEIGLDISYQAAIYETRSITGNVNPAVNGTYKTVFHARRGRLEIQLLTLGMNHALSMRMAARVWKRLEC